MTKLHVILCAILAVGVGGCGDDPPPPRSSAKGGAKKEGDATTPATSNPGSRPGTPGAKGKGPVQLQTYPKVADDFRKSLEKSDFAPDPSGDINRDPFRSYLLFLEQGPGKKRQGDEAIEDECEDQGIVAENFGLRDLKLAGIALRGSRSYALFIDSQSLGHTARRGDCLSKERARLKDIGADRVTIEIRGQAPPGAPAPPPREEVWKLYQEDLQLEMGPGKR